MPEVNANVIPANIGEYSYAWKNLTLNYVRDNWDKKLYHFIPYKHLLTLLRTGDLYFVNILKAWGNEPYELFYYRPNYFQQAGNAQIPVDVKDVSSHFYAQCWTENRDSNAMWSIYAGKNKDGVRIATTLGKIISLLYPVVNIGVIPFIGFMDYEWKKDIKAWVANHSNIPFADWREASIDSLFIKRMNFNYEKEFRIVLSAPSVLENGQINPPQDGLTKQININNFIEEITLSPFIDDTIRQRQYRKITRYLNGQILVRQSPLYKDDISNMSVVIH